MVSRRLRESGRREEGDQSGMTTRSATASRKIFLFGFWRLLRESARGRETGRQSQLVARDVRRFQNNGRWERPGIINKSLDYEPAKEARNTSGKDTETELPLKGGDIGVSHLIASGSGEIQGTGEGARFATKKRSRVTLWFGSRGWNRIVLE